MASIYFDVRRRGGIATTAELLRDGHSSHALTAAVRNGTIIRARQGHYATPELDPVELAAVRVGGRLTGLAGLRRHGVWTPVRIDLCVDVTAHSRGLRSPEDATIKLTPARHDGITVVWNPEREVGTRSLVGVAGCLRQVARTQPTRVAFAAAESTRYLGKLSEHEWRNVLATLSSSRIRALAGAGRLSESGGESLAAFGFRRAGIPFVQQAVIGGVGRVDFLLGERLVIEIDGGEFHTSRAAFEEDRRRDAALSVLGYRVLRFSYTQVADRWHDVHASVIAALLRGDHLA